jgi:hypothetical protein
MTLYGFPQYLPVNTVIVFHAINIENKEFEQVKTFKYRGSAVNTDNTIEEEIKERIALGNTAFFANKEFQSKLISKTVKLKLYCSVIRPAVT